MMEVSAVPDRALIFFAVVVVVVVTDGRGERIERQGRVMIGRKESSIRMASGYKTTDKKKTTPQRTR
jgi:hypothetical protein